MPELSCQVLKWDPESGKTKSLDLVGSLASELRITPTHTNGAPGPRSLGAQQVDEFLGVKWAPTNGVLSDAKQTHCPLAQGFGTCLEGCPEWL